MNAESNEAGEIDDHEKKPEVVGVNALSMGPSTPYSGGAISRNVEKKQDDQTLVKTSSRHRCDDAEPGCCDVNVSAPIASPELWDGKNIGLESDIYAFGIVMWEVFCRREAWHWRPKDDIIHSVGNEHLRPKIPPGLDETCAHWVRRCLHADPGPHRDP